MTAHDVDPVAPPEAAALATRLLDEVERAVVGKRSALEVVLLALLADGHVLVEDVPGVAKTTMARAFAAVTGLGFSRVQFTPDLLPMDITGSSVFDPARGTSSFRPGPVFTNLLLADEVNRAPAKTQAALLEAMQERQVTVDGTTHPLDRPFLVIATQNPIEYEGTYPLPEAQLDRFLLRLRVGYPASDAEREMLARRAVRGTEQVDLAAVVEPGQLLRLQGAVEEVEVTPDVGGYVVDVVGETRRSASVRVGASPRGALALMQAARAKALLAGRAFVTPDDVKAVAVPVLGHRLVLRPELWVRDVSGDDVVRECLERVPTPATVPDAP
ncbi:MAG: AAA family ATPase [Nitriliruptorales bacterium]